MVPSNVIELAGRRIAAAVSEAYAAEWAGVKNSIVHAALSDGRELVTA